MQTAPPIPADLEERAQFVARYVASTQVSAHPAPRRYGMANAAWEAARLRSRVSVCNSHGEFLCFD